MAYRELPPGLVTSIINEEEYSYAHLVKFEKPRNSSFTGQVSGKASDYAYFTDASFNISYDDGTSDNATPTNLNGTQVYVANKLLDVGTVNETTEARASNMNVVLSGTALGTTIIAALTFTSTSLTSNINLLDNGFQEGDKILLESVSGGNHNKYITVTRFSNANKTIHFSSEDSITASASPTSYNLSFASEEVAGLISSKSSVVYSSYINREVIIYRAHLNPTTGEIFGEPFLIFRGIIAKGSVDEDVTKGTKVTWNLTSHWGDFVRIQGRLTSDAYHRALSITGEPDVDALIRPEYGSDYGFIHAEKAINITGIYQTMETRYKMKRRGGIAGAIGGKKLVEYEVEVDREVDLQFNLSARMLPVVYGVQKVDSIPIFADTLIDDPATFYAAYAICEGEIGGIYDIHVDDSTTICIDKNDADVRTSGENVSVLCNGRADRGDVLASSSSSVLSNLFTQVNTSFGGITIPNLNLDSEAIREIFIDSSLNQPGGQGLQNEAAFVFTSPINAQFTMHTGKSDQRANQELASIAAEKRFKVQNEYYTGTYPYWSTSHTLLDTAYTVGKFTLSEGEVTLPKYEFVVKGKLINCYNYDGSYAGSGDESKFNLGDSVSIYLSSNPSTPIYSNIRIIDKWSFYGKNGILEYRFRFNTDLNVATNTEFFMKNSSNDIYEFTTWDYKPQQALSVGGILPTASISSASNSAYVLSVILSNPSSPLEAILTSLSTSLKIRIKAVKNGVTSYFSSLQVSSYNSSTNTLTFVFDLINTASLVVNAFQQGAALSIEFVNALKLNSLASSDNSSYIGSTIVLTEYVNDIPTSIQKVVSDYNGTVKVATFGKPFSEGYIPDTSFYYDILTNTEDLRATTNPALQLLDYLTNRRYGKGLDIEKDINLSSFIEAAKICDTQSDVTLILKSAVNVGDTYSYSYLGRLIFEGTVASTPVQRVVDGTTYYETTFTDIIGKLGYKWNNWRNFSDGDIYWHEGIAYLKSGVGTLPDIPTGTGALTSLSLSRTGGGTVNISISDGFTASGNPIVKRFTNSAEGFNSPGYSLYDSDEVKYWKYTGWDEQEQRYVTRHQTNQVINTSNPIFDNINSMLLQFNGVMRYSNGKYSLDIKTKAPDVFNTFETINEDDIIGPLKVDDKGQKDSFNSMSANIIDPANKYAARSISFFNSEYLKEDKGIRRQGNFAMPGVSNYYNARMNIKQYLDSSRYGLTISFTIDAKGYLLLAGSIIRLNYPRFGWDNKYFRIESLNFTKNGLVQVVAEEHNENAFLVEDLGSSILQIETGGGSPNTPTVLIAPPSNLQATLEGYGGILLTWTNTPTYNDSSHSIAIYRGVDNFFGNAEFLSFAKGSRYIDVLLDNTSETYYYWIKYILINSVSNFPESELHPLATEPGVIGETLPLIGGRTVKLLPNQGQVVAYEVDGTTENTTLSFTAVPEGFTGTVTYEFYLGTNEEAETVGVLGDTFTLQDANEPLPGETLIITVKVLEDLTGGVELPVEKASDIVTVYGIKNGAAGIDGITAFLTNESHSEASDFEGTLLSNLNDAGGTFKIFVGTTDVTGDVGITYSVVDATGISGSIAATGIYSLSNFTDNSGVVIFRAIISDSLIPNSDTSVTIEKTYSISKSKQGETIQPDFPTNTATIFLYKRATSAGTAPAITTYTYETGVLTGTLNGWEINIPEVNSAGDPLWIISYRAVDSTGAATESITGGYESTSGSWSDPAIFTQDGFNFAVVNYYKKTSSATPPGDTPGTITWTFSTASGSPTTSNGWTSTIPSVDKTEYLWIATSNASGAGTTDTVSSWDVAQISYFGDDGDSITVTGTTTVDGVTTVTFSDTTSITINDGDTQGVVPVYSTIQTPTSAGQLSFTPGSSHPFVTYAEYENTKPSLLVSEDVAYLLGQTYVRYEGVDGTSEGITPVYADNAGTNASLSATGKTYVAFYEWIGIENKPATIGDINVGELVFVKFVGLGAFSINQTNPNQALAADPAGSIISNAGTGNKIEVVYDGQLLAYDATGSLDPSWRAISSTTGTTSGIVADTTPSIAATSISYENASFPSWSVNTGSIVYTLEILIEGITTTATVTQNFIKNYNAAAVTLSIVPSTINFDSNEVRTGTNDITLSWTNPVIPPGATVTYKYYKDTTLLGTTSSTSVTYDISSFAYSSYPLTFTVEMLNLANVVIASDTTTLASVKEGEQAPGLAFTLSPGALQFSFDEVLATSSTIAFNWSTFTLPRSLQNYTFSLSQAVSGSSFVRLIDYTSVDRSDSFGISTNFADYPISFRLELKNSDTILDSSFPVGTQEITPQSISFSSEGTKMYILGDTGNDVTQYSLSIPWEVSSAIHEGQYIVGGQDTSPRGLAFSTDGTKMYMIGAVSDRVHQYTLSTPWNVLGTVTINDSYPVSSQEPSPTGVTFSSDGTKMYVVGTTGVSPNLGDRVYQYTLSTPWSVLGTVTFNGNYNVANQDTIPQDIRFSSDGTTMYIIGAQGDDVNQYTLATPWDILGTVTFNGSFSVAGEEIGPTGLAIDSNDSKLFVIGTQNDTVYQYSMPRSADVLSIGTIAEAFTSVSAVKNGSQGNTGFMYFLQNNTSEPFVGTIPAGIYEEGQIAIVQNTNNDQAGFRFDGTVWQPQTIVNSDIIFANAIKSQQLEISSDATSGARMFFNGAANRIEIYDGVLLTPRVVLGNLTGL